MVQEIVFEVDHEEEAALRPRRRCRPKQLHLVERCDDWQDRDSTQTTDTQLHDESVIAVRDKFMDVSGEVVSNEEWLPVPQHDDQHVQQDRGRLTRLPVRDTSRAFDAGEQGFHQRRIEMRS